MKQLNYTCASFLINQARLNKWKIILKKTSTSTYKLITLLQTIKPMHLGNNVRSSYELTFQEHDNECMHVALCDNF